MEPSLATVSANETTSLTLAAWPIELAQTVLQELQRVMLSAHQETTSVLVSHVVIMA